MAALHFRNQYEMQVPKEGITFTQPSKTQQEFKDECDINVIVKMYEATGIVNHTAEYQPVFADVAAYQGDLQEAYAMIDRANDSFMALPSALREELGHDPRNLVGYIMNPANKEKCIELGIFNKPAEVVQPNVVEPVTKE